MTDDELRHLVRRAIAQYGAGGELPAMAARPAVPLHLHPSHGRFMRLAAGADTDGPCLIEPTVLCNHCGYCQSFGH